MCTVTINRQTDRLVVTMNRDELWTREDESPPALHPAESGLEAWIAPADGERGGTWIGANAAGVVACILNAYAEGDLEMAGRPGVPSRGEIIPSLLVHDSEGAFRFVERCLDATAYPSFILIVSTIDRGVIARWTLGSGFELEPVGPGWSLVTSSWWRAAEVEEWRRKRFASWLEAGAPHYSLVSAFNLLEEPGKRDHSPFMTRSYSGTRSVTQISMDRQKSDVEMRYWSRAGEESINPSNVTSQLRLELTSKTRRANMPAETKEERKEKAPVPEHRGG